MVNIDFYSTIGYAVELLSKSEYHKQYAINNYLLAEILPAMRRGQVKIYLTEQGIPVAMISWAMLSDAAQVEIHETGRALDVQDWQSGDNLFFNDFIAPYGNAKEIIRDVKTVTFPDHIATSIQRNMDGSVRKIQKWTGVNVRKNQILEVIL